MHAARFLGGLVHVEQDLCLAALLHRAQQAADVEARRRPSRYVSPIDSTRWVEAIRVVRSGVTKPLKIMRPASSELGRQRHVDLADRRIERQHRGCGARVGITSR